LGGGVSRIIIPIVLIPAGEKTVIAAGAFRDIYQYA
jgi:hypothetical protein